LGKLMDKNNVKSQNTGAAIKKPSTQSLSVCVRLPAASPCDTRRPRTANTKHNAQLKTKPAALIRAALAKTPAETHAKACQSACSAPDA
jgi:hypothetical protein